MKGVAVILGAAHAKAEEWAGPADAALCQALDAATEIAVILAQDPTGGTTYPVEQVFADLVTKYT